MTKTGYLKRYRNPIIIIKIAILLHIYLPSRIVLCRLMTFVPSLMEGDKCEKRDSKERSNKTKITK